MGGNSSKVTSDALTDIAISAIQSTIQGCTSSATQSQIISIPNVSGNLTIGNVGLSQGVSLDIECIMSAEKQNEMHSKIANAIAQEAKSISTGMLQSLGGTSAEAATNIKTKFSANITQSDTQEALNQIIQNQSLFVGNVGGNLVIGNINFDQSAELVSRTLLTSGAYSRVINDISNTLTQVAETESTGMDKVFADMVETLGIASLGAFAIPLLIGIIILSIGAVAIGGFFLFGGGGGSAGQMGPVTTTVTFAPSDSSQIKGPSPAIESTEVY